MEKIKIQPTYAAYANDDWRIYKGVVVDKMDSEIFKNGMDIGIVGDMHALNYNKQYIAVGEYEESKYGKQLKVAYINEIFEETNKDLQKMFLKEILTENQYKSLTETLEDPFKALKEKDVKLLTTVKGIKDATAYKLIDKYEASIDYSEAFATFGKLGVSVNMIKRIAKSYASPRLLIEKFEENPYILANSVEGIGFKTADDIALKKGIEVNSPKRIKAFIRYELNDNAQSLGDTYTSKQEMYAKWLKFSELGNTKDIFADAINDLVSNDILKLIKNGEVIILSRYYNGERKLSKELLRISDASNIKTMGDAEEIIDKVEEEQGFKFNYEQREAVMKILINNLLAIIGAAGVGKTSVAKAIVEIIGKDKSAATALSGKAGQRLSETTGITGQTIHRLLGYNPSEGFMVNKDNPLDLDLIVVDESSMIDIGLFNKLVEAIPNGCKLVILGDTHQLQSIGAGNVLLDVMNSGVVASVELTKIHRQAQKSGIITVATKIRNGERFIKSGFVGEEIIGELQDFKLIVQKNAKESSERVTKDVIIKEFSAYLDKGVQISDIQVIVPMKKRGDASTQSLNTALQEIYNPSIGDESEIVTTKFKEEYILRVGDKVICKKNNYKTTDLLGMKKPIFNGSMGIIKSVSKDDKNMVVEFQNIGSVMIDKGTMNSIELAYAITIHSAQGSQWKKVIVGIDYSMYTMLNKELLYTAVTRAMKECILIGEAKAISHAIRTSNLYTRRTLLKRFLRKFEKEVTK